MIYFSFTHMLLGANQHVSGLLLLFIAIKSPSIEPSNYFPPTHTKKYKVKSPSKNTFLFLAYRYILSFSICFSRAVNILFTISNQVTYLKGKYQENLMSFLNPKMFF